MEPCPDDIALRSYHDGRLDDVEADPIEQHLETCEACRRLMEAIRKSDLSARIVRAAARSDATRAAPEDGMNSFPGSVEPADASPPGTDGDPWDVPDYKRVRLCGEGAYGSVWAVRDRVGIFRALKVIDLRPLRSTSANRREMTALETYCRLVASHEHLVRIFHVGLRGAMLYYVMELADNEVDRAPVHDRLPDNYRPFTLQQVLRRKRLHPDAAIEVALRLLRGLAHLHSVRLAHRDIKPANIIFVNHQPKLADIGMVTSGDEAAPPVGTPEYMPPDRQMDYTADTYAMGKVLHEMLCRGLDCEAPTLPKLVSNSAAKWDMDRVQRCIARACSERAEDRYASAERMIEDLESCRLLSLESLLADQGEDTSERRRSAGYRTSPVLVAAANALPWVLGLLLAMMILRRLW